MRHRVHKTGVNPIEETLAKLQDVRKSGNRWLARCPAHDDRTPSLSVTKGKNGRVLLFCHAGCSFNDICAAMGSQQMEMFDRDNPVEGQTRRNEIVKMEFKSLSDGTGHLVSRRGRPTGRWIYHDKDGAVAGVVFRWDTPHKSFVPLSLIKGRWTMCGMMPPRPLYKLPQILATDQPVWVVEGEKAADAMWDMGFVATTSNGGANGARQTNWTPLAGSEVIILPDADEPGGKYAQEVGERCLEAGANEVSIVAWGNVPKGYDAADVLAERGRDTGRAEVELLNRSPFMVDT